MHRVYIRTALAALLALAFTSVPRGAVAQADPQAMIGAAQSVEAAAKALMETLRVVPIPAYTRDRQEMLGDVAGDAEQIQHVSHYLTRKLGKDIGDRHLQKSVHRMSRDFKDMRFNANLLAVPDRVKQDIDKLGAAVQALERLYAGGSPT